MSTVIDQLRYAVVGTRDLDAAMRFAGEELGLQPVPHGDDHVAFRADARQYSLVYARGDARRDAVGLEVRDESALQAIDSALAALGITLERDAALATRRNVRVLAAFSTPGGVRIELVVRPQNQGWRFFPSRDTGMRGLAAVVLRSTDVAADEELWTAVLGARVADWVGEATYLGFDDAHHRIALVPARQPGVLAVEFEAEGINAVMQQFHRLRALPEAVLHGPGRRPASAQVFLTFAGPDAIGYSFVADGDAIDRAAPPRPRQFAAHASSHCAWGSECRIAELNGTAVAPRAGLRGVPRR